MALVHMSPQARNLECMRVLHLLMDSSEHSRAKPRPNVVWKPALQNFGTRPPQHMRSIMRDLVRQWSTNNSAARGPLTGQDCFHDHSWAVHTLYGVVWPGQLVCVCRVVWPVQFCCTGPCALVTGSHSLALFVFWTIHET